MLYKRLLKNMERGRVKIRNVKIEHDPAKVYSRKFARIFASKPSNTQNFSYYLFSLFLLSSYELNRLFIMKEVKRCLERDW